LQVALSQKKKPELRHATLMELEDAAKPMNAAKYDKITIAITKSIAKMLDRVTDEGLQNVLRIATENQSYTLSSSTSY
jgi:hypothetical protein